MLKIKKLIVSPIHTAYQLHIKPPQVNKLVITFAFAIQLQYNQSTVLQSAHISDKTKYTQLTPQAAAFD